jgi:predicted NAD-dependent protein-ADP-ribosyltransferase YbiA (DUF1768 family)
MLCRYPCNPWQPRQGALVQLKTKLQDEAPYTFSLYDAKVVTIAKQHPNGGFMKLYFGTTWMLFLHNSPGELQAPGSFQVTLDNSGNEYTFNTALDVLSAMKQYLASKETQDATVGSMADALHRFSQNGHDSASGKSTAWATFSVKVVACAGVFLLKFSQVDAYRTWLLASGTAFIIEAEQGDGVWGIGKSLYQIIKSLDNGHFKPDDFSLKDTYYMRKGDQRLVYDRYFRNPDYNESRPVGADNPKVIRKRFENTVGHANILGKALMITRTLLIARSEPRKNLVDALQEVVRLLDQNTPGSLRHAIDLEIIKNKVIPLVST